MFNVKVSFIVLIGSISLLSLSGFATQETSCASHYSHYNDSRVLINSKSVIERFSDFYKSHETEFFGLVLSQFFESEMNTITSKYDSNVKKLELKGTESKLESELKLLDIHVNQLQAALKEISSLLEPKKALSFFRLESSRKKKLESKSEEAAQCRNKMEVCVTSLNSAMTLANKTMSELQIILAQVKQKKAEIVDLQLFINENKSSYNSTVSSSDPIFQRYLEKINYLILTTEAIIETQSKSLTVATLTLMDVPVYHQQIKELIARGAPESLEKKIEKTITQELSQLPKQIGPDSTVGVMAILSSNIDSNAKIESVYSEINKFHSITMEDANLILSNSPMGAQWGLKSVKSTDYGKALKRHNGNDFSDEFYSFGILITYKLADLAIPSKSKNQRDIFFNAVKRHLEGEAKDKSLKYQVAISKIIAELQEKFK